MNNITVYVDDSEIPGSIYGYRIWIKDNPNKSIIPIYRFLSAISMWCNHDKTYNCSISYEISANIFMSVVQILQARFGCQVSNDLTEVFNQ